MPTVESKPAHPKATDTAELRKFLHDIANALNAAKINAYLLHRMHGPVLDKETADGLDSALLDAEKLVAEYHRRVHEEITDSAHNVDEEQRHVRTEATK